MSAPTFQQSPGPFPKPYDLARAERTLGDLAIGEGAFIPEGVVRTLLESTFGNSPYLARLALRDRDGLRLLLEGDPQSELQRVEAETLAVADAPDMATAMAILRRAKRRAALTIALADIGGLWNVQQVTMALTRFADAAVKGALRFILKETAASNGYTERDPVKLEATTGLVVLAMGKYGAFELNYSSDIDLVVFYDAQKFPFRKRDDIRAAAVDVVKALVKLIAEITSDGYVFRTDLRLRPDAGATQVAISTDAAEAYYEGMGQNWERAAMIKARACAGDPETGAHFLKALEPFVWRKNLDYASIEDIHSIKRQIHAHEGHAKIAVAGHNIKLGRGGIREIEFFAQTQQLILGGRNPNLRPRATLEALTALRERNLIAQKTEDELKEAYLFFRHLEHRLQMIEDEQTHTLPKSEEGLAHIACFAGFDNVADFSKALTTRLQTVTGHYSRLFEREAPLASDGGSLVFAGVEEDPETLETLTKLGFSDPRHVSAAIRGWHHGRVRAMRSARARERLTQLVPALLEALAKTADPDGAFAQFDRFLSGLPTGIQLFSMLHANPQLLTLIAEIAGSAPRIATHLARSPATLDALIDPGFLGELPTRRQLDKLVANQFAAARDFEGALDAARRVAKEQIFRVGAQIVDGVAKAEEAGPAFANIADSIIAGLLPVVEAELAAVSGHIEGGEFSVIAMGKLGGREMTASSDLDLIFVYDAPPDAESTGPKKLPVLMYYARLAQRFIAALTAPTAEGTLYEVDMRLRPTGNKGPVAVSLESFTRYHETESWTWERMALTRARVVAFQPNIRRKVEQVLIKTLTTAVDGGKLLRDARDMRDKLAMQFPGKSRWDLKFTRGGLVDIEFIAQILQLRQAPISPNVLHQNTVEALQCLMKDGALSPADAELLVGSAKLQGDLQQILRIAIDTTLDPQTASPGLKALLARAGEAADFAALEAKLADAQTTAREIFERVLPG
ncbi:MAG TPA: bifunctional [glutamine synthetase] adenylyltransferase/[glutamine synthetase]-adenylyl-L-tyrosine phosphorylase [Rhizomicrobium sp.]